MPRPGPSLMFEAALNALKGWYDLSAIDYTAKVSPSVTIELKAGRVAHLNAVGELETGISGTQMPLYLLQSDSDADVSNPGITPGGRFMHIAIAPSGNMTGLVATGGYEVETTEFDQTPNVAYAPNQLLTAAVANTTAATGGVLSNDRAGAGGSSGAVRQYVDPACGVVSRGHYNNEHGVPVLAFWTIYLPAAFV